MHTVRKVSYELFAYFIQAHTGHFEGGTDHQFHCETADHNLLLDTTPVVTWPTDVEAAEPPAGYPPGASVTEWLVGTVAGGSPYDGLIPFHFPTRVDFGGVNPIFDTILLDAVLST